MESSGVDGFYLSGVSISSVTKNRQVLLTSLWIPRAHTRIRGEQGRLCLSPANVASILSSRQIEQGFQGTLGMIE